MRNLIVCERCEGCGADPQQTLFEEEITPCIDCYGDGCYEQQDAVERVSSAIAHLKLSA